MTEPSRGVLDTSVLIDHDIIAAEQRPDESAITAVTLAEIAAGPHATENKDARQAPGSIAVGDRHLGSTAFRRGRGTDVRQVFAAARAAGQSSRARLADLLIASTAAANGLPLYTRNPADFAALKRMSKWSRSSSLSLTSAGWEWSGRWESKISLARTRLLES